MSMMNGCVVYLFFVLTAFTSQSFGDDRSRVERSVLGDNDNYPYFSGVRGGSNQKITAVGEVIPFTLKEHEQPNTPANDYYNGSHFTVPLKGIYHFSVSIASKASSDNLNVVLIQQKAADPATNKQIMAVQCLNPSDSGSNAITVFSEEGDVYWVESASTEGIVTGFTGNGVTGGATRWSIFTGFMVHRLYDD